MQTWIPGKVFAWLHDALERAAAYVGLKPRRKVVPKLDRFLRIACKQHSKGPYEVV